MVTVVKIDCPAALSSEVDVDVQEVFRNQAAGKTTQLSDASARAIASWWQSPRPGHLAALASGSLVSQEDLVQEIEDLADAEYRAAIRGRSIRNGWTREQRWVELKLLLDWAQNTKTYELSAQKVQFSMTPITEDPSDRELFRAYRNWGRIREDWNDPGVRKMPPVSEVYQEAHALIIELIARMPPEVVEGLARVDAARIAAQNP